MDKTITFAKQPFPVKLIVARDFARSRLPGISFCLVIVLAAGYITEHYGSPLILGTLLLGMALHSISAYEEFSRGLEFCAKQILRIGIALLGIRITFAQISDMGLKPYWLVLSVVIGTLLFSLIVARIIKLDLSKAIISGAAVGICGVSAALAVASVLDNEKEREQHLLCTLVGVTGISTICMIFYPGLAALFDLSAAGTGMFLGASIHDVAQVFGAGDMVSEEVAQLATYTKMLRVALLVPVIMVLALLVRKATHEKSTIERAFPPFLLFFILFVIIANLQVVPPPATEFISSVSKICLCVAIAALGARTNLLELLRVGKKPLLLLFCNTIFIAAFALILVI
jgi:uncharacterized integral membrane protein (TIGR00698 family)